MLSADEQPVVSAPRAVMATPASIAERDGVSRQAVSKKVRELADQHGLTVERDGRNRIVKFNVVEYDLLRERYCDPSKDQAPPGEDPPPQSSESYDEAVRQRAWHDAERKRLELEEHKGNLVRTAAVGEAAAACAEEIVRVTERPKSEVDNLAAAYEKNGAHGLRIAIKKMVERQRRDIADALARLPEQIAKTRSNTLQ